MRPVRSVFERRWKTPCVLATLALCCHAQASDGTGNGAQGSPRDEQAPAYRGLVAPETGNIANCSDTASCSAAAPAQTSYLAGIKRFFNKDRLLSRLGFFGRSTAHEIQDVRNIVPVEASATEGANPEQMPGYMLNLNLKPTPQSSMDLRYGWGAVSYVANDNDPLRQSLMSRGVKYALFIDDCLRLEGLYGRSAGLDRFGFGLAQDNWSVSLAGGAGTSLLVGYSIPLGRTSAQSRSCNSGLNAGTSFDAVGDAALRPPLGRRGRDER